MPEETTIRPSEVVSSQEPRSEISAGEVAAPYQRLGRALDKLGESFEAVAKPLAERAGYEAVTRDADGNIKVDRMPIFGAAGAAYARAVKVAALAQGEGDAKRADLELREQFRDNPQGYQEAARNFKDKTVQQYQAAAGPEVAQSVGQAIDNTTTLTYRGLLNEKERLDLVHAENSMKAGQESATNDLMACARAGCPQSDPAFRAAIDKYNSLSMERAANPRLAYTQEERAHDLQELQSQLGGQRFLYHIDQVYKDKGYQAAADEAKDVLTNPDYGGLTEQQRQAYNSHALSELRVNEAIRKQDVSEARAALDEMKDRVANGDRVEPSEIWALRNTFEKLNNPRGVLAVDNAFRHKDLHDDFARLPLHEMNMTRHALVGATAARDMMDTLVNRFGYSREQAAGMAASAVYESSLRPTAFNPAGGGQGAVGLFQWRGERLQQLKDYAASQGKGYLDPQVQIEFAHRELQSSESVAGGLLRAATTPEEAARVFAQSFERGEGRDTAQRMALARSLYEGKSSDGSGGPGGRSWEIANRDATIKTTATEQLKAVKADFDKGEGVPDIHALDDIIEAAKETNNVELGAKAEALAHAIDYVNQIKQLPLDEQRYAETEMRRQLEIGSKDYVGADMILKQLEAITEKTEKELKDNAISLAVTRFPDKWKTPPPLNLADPQQFRNGLAMRAQIAQGIANNYGVAPVAALGKADVDRVQQALANPDLGVKTAVWGMLATLPEDVRGPTFEKIAKGDKNMLAEASAGAMMNTRPELGKSIMAGLQLMSHDESILKAFEPKSGGTEGFNVDVINALPPTTFDLEGRTNPSGNYATTVQMIKARYAYLAANDPKAKGAIYNPKLVNQAVEDVTGGILSHGGAKMIAPTPGMTQTQLDSIMRGITDTELAGVTSKSGEPITADYLRRYGRLEATGAGKYLVNFSNTEKPIYAYSGWGDAPGAPVRRFELDLSGRKPPATPAFAETGYTPFTEFGYTSPAMPGPASPPPAPLAPGSRGPPQPRFDEHYQPPTIGIRG
jgi:hypothetical protein